MPPSPVILFDGVCHLCDRWVRFVIRRDPAARFRFAPLQSDAGRALAEAHGIDAEALDSIVLIDVDGSAYRCSDAALRILRRVRGPWRLAWAFRLVPRPLRDAVYGFVARRRYRWFGREDACIVPTDDVRDRFLA